MTVLHYPFTLSIAVCSRTLIIKEGQCGLPTKELGTDGGLFSENLSNIRFKGRKGSFLLAHDNQGNTIVNIPGGEESMSRKSPQSFGFVFETRS